MGCNCGGSGGGGGRPSVGRWVLTLPDGTHLPYAVEWEAREAAGRNPGATYAWVVTEYPRRPT